MKQLLILLFGLFCFFVSDAQIIAKKVPKSGPIQQIPKKKLPVPVTYAGSLTSHRKGDIISRPLVLRGRGMPGATIRIVVSALCNYPANQRSILPANDDRYHIQMFDVKVDQYRDWHSPSIDVRYVGGAFNKKVKVDMAQIIPGEKAVSFFNYSFDTKDTKDEIELQNQQNNKEYVLSIVADDIMVSSNYPVKLGVSQWSDVVINGNNIANNNSGQNNEILCWWEGIGESPKIVNRNKDIYYTRQFTVKYGDIANGYIDIWTKYIANYPVSDKEIKSFNIVFPPSILFKKTKSYLQERGFNHYKVGLQYLLDKGGKSQETVGFDWDQKKYRFIYNITLQPK